MPDQENPVELKFRLYDGSDIGPIRCASSSTVSMLKERIISEWPRGLSSSSSSLIDKTKNRITFCLDL